MFRKPAVRRRLLLNLFYSLYSTAWVYTPRNFNVNEKSVRSEGLICDTI